MNPKNIISQTLVTAGKKSLGINETQEFTEKTKPKNHFPFEKQKSIPDLHFSTPLKNQNRLNSFSSPLKKNKNKPNSVIETDDLIKDLSSPLDLPFKNVSKENQIKIDQKEIQIDSQEKPEHLSWENDFENILGECEEEHKLDSFEKLVDDFSSENEKEEEPHEPTSIYENEKEEEPHEPSSIYYNRSLDINFEPPAKKDDFVKIEEEKDFEFSKEHQMQFKMMQETKNEFLVLYGNDALNQSSKFLEEMKELYSDYNKMFNYSNNTEPLQNLSAEEKKKRLVEKEAIISTMDPSKQTIMRILTRAFHERDIDVTITNESTALLREFFSSYIQSDQIYLELKFDEKILPFPFEKFMNNSKIKGIYIDYFRILIHEITDVPINDVIFMNFKKGSVKLEMLLANICKDNPTEKIKLMREKISMELSHLFPGFFRRLDVQLLSFVNKLCLSPLDFDSKGDFQFPNPNGDRQNRGGLIYIQPTSKWCRYGLVVRNLYENNNWLTMNGNPEEWAVAFHGTRSSNDTAIQSIIESREIKKAHRNAYGGLETCTPRKRKVPIRGVYCAWDVENCYKQKIEVDGQNYEIAFQCRVHPDFLFPVNNGAYVVVSDSKYIRPYGIVIKKID